MITLTSLSLGEILQKAGINTLLGMGVVFSVLVIISLLIYCMRFIPVLIEGLGGKGKKREQAEEPAARSQKASVDPAAASVRQPAATAPAANAAAAETDLTLIAVITAAIAAAADVPADGIVIRSIRRSTKNKWKRA